MSQLLPLLLSLFLLSVFTYNSSLNSQAFFKGLISEGLNSPNWNDSIINYVNSTNFNIQSIIKSIDILLQNERSPNLNLTLEAISEITIPFLNAINGLFPIVSFSLRFNGIRRLILPHDAPVFNLLNQSFCLYGEGQIVYKIMRKYPQIDVLNRIEQAFNQENFFSAGFNFQKLTQNILGKTPFLVNFRIDIDLSNASKIIEENYHSQQLVMGLLSGLDVGDSFTKTFLIHINSTIFNQHEILKGFGLLSKNSFNFSQNPKDQEIFVETVGEISLSLRNLKNIAEEYGSKELARNLDFVFNLFSQHQNLFESIQFALHQKIDVRKYFKEMYVEGENNGNYEEAGKTLAEIYSILNNRSIFTMRF